jgi:hypothetical protein
MRATKTAQSSRREAQNLEIRYGEIGISAVVAAIRYQGFSKSPAPASTERQPDHRLNDTVSEFAA